ncbi:MAG: hypothetical protein HW387_567 [Parachlamydiales bacterium]|nr:hypothetical protein [Parachlamydiales bacterium]
MKKYLPLTLAAMLLLSPMFAKDLSFPMIRQTIALTELDPAFINEFISGMHPDIAVECNEGTVLPLGFMQSWGLFSLKCAPNLTVKVEQPCYFRCSGKKVYISQDLVTWEKARKIFSGKSDFKVKIDAKSGILIESKTIPYSQDNSDED